MRKVHLSKFERVAGLFILVAIGGALLSALSVAVKQGWFEKKTYFVTTFENADGVHSGATVKMAGLNAGSVSEVELLSDNKVRITFYVLGKFRDRIRQDSKAQLIRPFIIGDRVLEVSVGNEASAELAEHGHLPSEESLDLMTLMSGKKMGQAFARMGAVVDNMENVMTAFGDRQRMDSIVRMFDRMEPLIANLGTMATEITKLSRQATKDENLSRTLANAAVLTRELNLIVPEMNKANPELGQDLAKLTGSLGKMTAEMEAALTEMGPEGRSSARRALEALNEATVLMKALQKSFFLRSSVREVREEEAKERLPAATP